MEYLWWILPATAGVIGLMLSFAGLGRLLKLRLAAGGFRFLFGVGILGVAGISTLAGLNLQTYQRLSLERPVAVISFERGEDSGALDVRLSLAGGETRDYKLEGDEFAIGAQVVTFEAMANLLGYDSVYRLHYLEGRDAGRYNTQTVTPSRTNGIRLSENPGLDVHALAREEGAPFGMKGTRFGSAVYAPMAPGLSYEVRISQDALVLRPANPQTERQMQRGS